MLDQLIILAGQDGVDVLETSERLMEGARDVMQLLGTVIAIGLVLVTYITTRAIVATLGAVLLAAVVLWGIYNPAFLRRSTEETINNAGAMIETTVADAGMRG